MTSKVLLLVLLACGPCLPETRWAFRKETSAYLHGSVVVARNTLTGEEAWRLAQDVLSEARARIAVVNFHEDGKYPTRWQLVPTHGAYAWWMNGYREPDSLLPYARLMVDRGGYVLDVFHRDGRIDRRRGELEGNRVAPVADATVVHIGFEPPHLGGAGEDTLVVFVRAKPPATKEGAASLSEALMKHYNVKSLVVHVREDSWFIGVAHYPTVQPPEETAAPPQRQVLNASPYWLCVAQKGTESQCRPSVLE